MDTRMNLEVRDLSFLAFFGAIAPKNAKIGNYVNVKMPCQTLKIDPENTMPSKAVKINIR